MIDVQVAVAGVAAGMALGVVFFGGLLLTTARVPRARNASLVAAASFIGRLGISLAGLFLVARFMGLTGIMSALAGLVVTQIVFVRLAMKRKST